ncbi:MAG: hypothetical protein Q4A75_05605 [Peptostreptococcaceae bacterium]|nr:hypothetical protein [Peptostreptococcaceae bacterium]
MDNFKKVLLRIFLGVVAVVVIFAIVVGAKIYIELEGSPFDRMKVKEAAREHLIENDIDGSLEVMSVDFDYKRKIYRVEIGRKDEGEVLIELEIDPDGEVLKSSYDQSDMEDLSSGST